MNLLPLTLIRIGVGFLCLEAILLVEASSVFFVPEFLRNGVPPWTLSLQDPYDNWGYIWFSINPDWGSSSGGNPNGVSILWNRPTCVLTIYHNMIFENTRSAECRACGDLLMENCIYRMKSTSTSCNPIRGRLVN